MELSAKGKYYLCDKVSVSMQKITDEIASLPIVLTDGAAEEILRIRNVQEIDDSKLLRIGVKGGGCAGFSYIIEFDDQKKSDELFISNDVKILLDKAQKLYLNGTTLDFSAGLENRGFTFSNPNADKTCGCGSSFG